MQSYSSVSEVGGRGSRVDEDVVLRQLLDVHLELLEFALTALVLILETDRVQFALVRESLIFFVDDLPLLLEGGNELSLLILVHEELLAIHISLFLDLHLAH